MARAMITSLMGTLALIFLAGAITLQFFVVLSGLNSTTPLDKTYFLRADTSNITGARDVTQWTYLFICGKGNEDCGKAHPALPFGYAWDSDAEGAPGELIGNRAKHTTSSYYFYVWRFGWVFCLLGLFFTVCTFFGAFTAPCFRLASKLSAVAAAVALMFWSIGVSLMTVEFVKARDVFRSEGRDASVGQYAFGFCWGAWAAIFIAICLLWMGGKAHKHASGSVPPPRRRRGLPGLFGRGRTRSVSRGGVKDEYH